MITGRSGSLVRFLLVCSGSTSPLWGLLSLVSAGCVRFVFILDGWCDVSFGSFTCSGGLVGDFGLPLFTLGVNFSSEPSSITSTSCVVRNIPFSGWFATLRTGPPTEKEKIKWYINYYVINHYYMCYMTYTGSVQNKKYQTINKKSSEFTGTRSAPNFSACNEFTCTYFKQNY